MSKQKELDRLWNHRTRVRMALDAILAVLDPDGSAMLAITNSRRPDVIDVRRSR